MRVVYRFAIIGVFVLAAIAAGAFLPGMDGSAPATTVTAATQPSLDARDLPPLVQQLLGAPKTPGHSLPSSESTAQSCIAKGQTCVINGTPCCAGSCQGNFPNTYCQ
jgi:hypothetical protein